MSNGRLGHGDEEDVRLTRRVEAPWGSRPVTVAAAFQHSLALTEAGALFRWGQGQSGRLGHGHEDDLLVPCRVASLEGVVVFTAAAGCYHSLAICAAGRVYSFGYGGNGQLGHGSTSHKLLPRRVEGALATVRVTSAAAGHGHSIVACREGQL